MPKDPPATAAPRRERSRIVSRFSGARPLGRVIEHVFLTYEGTPLVELSRNFVPGRDPDLIASMFTAIQNFLDDSFHEMGIGAVRSIELGDRHQVAFGRGKRVLLYVVYRGRESNQLERHVIHQVREIEERFAAVLEDWDGDMDAVAAVREYLVKVWFFTRDLATAALENNPAALPADAIAGSPRSPGSK